VGVAVGAGAAALIGLARSGYKLFKNMDSSFKEADPNNQVMKQLEHWAKSQEHLQWAKYHEDLKNEIKRREGLANELQEAERRIKELERKLSGKEADEARDWAGRVEESSDGDPSGKKGDNDT
jgi:DNA repair exonuclease SbcCD ATPase subunit